MPGLRIARKWRPPLWLVVAGLALLLLALPIAALMLARLAENQFVRETERSLIAQAVIFSELYADALAEEVDDLPGRPIPEAAQARLSERYHPVEPRLDADETLILEEAEETRPIPHPPLAVYEAVAARIEALARGAQKTTLAGYRFTDAAGRVIGSSGAGLDTSLAHLPEVRAALRGEVASVLRYRGPRDESHALASISRDTMFRVHVAHPVIVGDRISGVVHVSRTPLNLGKFLYSERVLLGQMAFAMVAGAALLGFVFWRFISRPILALRTQSREVASGVRPAPEPLEHYGVAELADLGQSVLSMANALTERADGIITYTDHVTHELKSPVTSIVGAAELLGAPDDRMDAARRRRLVDTIHAEGLRMDALLARLRDLVRARMLATDIVETEIAGAVMALRRAFPGLEIVADAPSDFRVPLSPEALDVVLTQLAKNAAEHGATELRVISGTKAGDFLVRDNGNGIGQANRAKVFEPFFTTRRESGGTGMGLSIVASVIGRRGGRVHLGDGGTGAEFRFSFDR